MLSFVLKDQVKKVPPLGGRIELCGSSSCLGGLGSLLNMEGILTLPMFLLGDGSFIWMWSASFAQQCRVLLSLSIIVKSLSSAFGCFVEIWWFLMALVVWFLWSETLCFQGPVGFTYVFSCAVVGKVRIPSVFNKLLKPPRQLELPHSSIPLLKGAPSSFGPSKQKTINTSRLLDLHLQ